MSVQLPIIKKISPRRCVGTRHHRYLGQTMDVNNAVSRLMIMGNLKDMILRKTLPETGFLRRSIFPRNPVSLSNTVFPSMRNTKEGFIEIV